MGDTTAFSILQGPVQSATSRVVSGPTMLGPASFRSRKDNLSSPVDDLLGNERIAFLTSSADMTWNPKTLWSAVGPIGHTTEERGVLRLMKVSLHEKMGFHEVLKNQFEWLIIKQRNVLQSVSSDSSHTFQFLSNLPPFRWWNSRGPQLRRSAFYVKRQCLAVFNALVALFLAVQYTFQWSSYPDNRALLNNRFLAQHKATNVLVQPRWWHLLLLPFRLLTRTKFFHLREKLVLPFSPQHINARLNKDIRPIIKESIGHFSPRSLRSNLDLV